jgi:glutathione S-transferase
VIKLYQFPPIFGRNISPFALKLEAWLKLAGLPYQVVAIRNPGQGPKGKLPFIEDDDGQFIADSSLIIEHLSRTRGVDLDAGLEPGQQALALALQRLFEDHLYFIGVWGRWIDPEGWATFGPAVFAGVPPPLRQIVGGLVRRRIRKKLDAQGIGRHRQDELYAMGRADLEAVSTMLADRQFFLADRPTTIDAVAYGFLANLLLVPIEGEPKRIAGTFANLVAWTEAMERRLG